MKFFKSYIHHIIVPNKRYYMYIVCMYLQFKLTIRTFKINNSTSITFYEYFILVANNFAQNCKLNKNDLLKILI